MSEETNDTKKKSFRWSKKDIAKINKFVAEAKQAGAKDPNYTGYKNAAEYFKVTYNAVYLRMYKSKKGTYVKHLKKSNTTKLPVNRKKRKYVRKEGIIQKAIKNTPATRSISLDIKNVDINLATGKLTINY